MINHGFFGFDIEEWMALLGMGLLVLVLWTEFGK